MFEKIWCDGRFTEKAEFYMFWSIFVFAWASFAFFLISPPAADADAADAASAQIERGE